MDRDTAKEKMKAWYKELSASNFSGFIDTKSVLRAKDENLLNIITTRATCAAEALNSKIKGSIPN